MFLKMLHFPEIFWQTPQMGILGKPHLKVLDFVGFRCKGLRKMLDFPGILGKHHLKLQGLVARTF